MSTLSKVDPSTLGWVKTEIDETLKQARLALEAYAENTADDSKLRFCATYLHQVLGTLQMVELDGAAMLARETEALASAILNGQVTSGPAAIETLIRGILTLPDYLARLQVGQPDSPLRVFSLLNELRTARGEAALDELDLFQPDLDVRPPRRDGAVKRSDAEYAAAVKTLRPAFQATLLNWLRDSANSQHLNDLGTLLERLRDEAPLPLFEQHFWVAGGYLDALAGGTLELSNERKRLLARIEQELKKIAEGADKRTLRNSVESLTKAMLYELAHARTAAGRAGEIRRAFELEALLPGGEADYELPTPEALRSVAEALGAEITQAQDLLSTCFEGGDAASLEPLATLLKRMSGTLAMLNVEPLRLLVEELAGIAEALARGEMERSEALSMPLAGALLLLENSTRNFQALGPAWKRQVDDTIEGLKRIRAGEELVEGVELSDAALTEAEFKQLVSAVGGEIRANLGKIEEALETFAADTNAVAQLEPVPQHLSQIQGALQILGQERAAEIVATTQYYVQNICDRQLGPDSAVLDALAVSVGSIGAYIEGLERDRPHLESILAPARKDLAAALTGKRPHSGNPEALVADMQQSFGAWLADHGDRAAVAALTQDLRDVAWLADSQHHERISKLCAQMIGLLDMVDSGEVSDDVEVTLRQSHDALATLARGQLRSQALARSAPRVSSLAKAEAVVAPPTPAPASVPRPAVAADEADDDIMLIFIEDAREMIALIEKTLPAWHNDPANRDVLLDLRRAFHTLKGSGRMVGASDISEFAWAVENMLNKVREGKIEPAPMMFELLFKAREVLPDMVAQLEGGPGPQADILALRAIADAIGEGRPVDPGGVAAASEAGATVAAAAPAAVETPPAEPAVDELPQLDATLLQIFSNEVRGHIANVRAEITSCREAGLGGHVAPSLIRAVHTLQGTARALGLKPMADANAETERLLHTLQTREATLNDDDYAHLDRLTNVVEQLIDALNRGERRVPALVREFAAIAQAAHQAIGHHGEDGAAHAPPAVVEPPPAAPPAVRPAAPPPAPPAAERPRAAPPPAPARKATATTLDGDVVRDTLDPELTEIFLEEAVDILAAIEESLTRWRGHRADKAAIAELKRQLHTLKGGARMSGAMTMGNLGHQTESLLGEIELGRVSADSDIMDLMDEVHDALVTMVDRMQAGGAVPAFTPVTNKVLARLGAPLIPVGTPAGADATPPAAPGESPVAATRAVEPARPAFAPSEPAAAAFSHDAVEPHIDRRHEEDRRHEPEEAPEAVGTADRRGQIRVRTSLLNELVNSAGEVSIARARMEQQIFGLRDNLAELNSNVTRFRDQIRELEIQSESQMLARAQAEASRAGDEFDPLELDRFSRLQTLSRSLAESLHDLFTIRGNLENYASQAETVLQQQARINTELQEGLMRTRMIGFGTQGARLRHIVRQTAREVGKRVELEFIGAEVEVDRTVLERMIGPFEHMVRNAIDHGIEAEAERRQAGKPVTGKISVIAANEGSEVVIRFGDDGAGLDIAAIRRKAIERGLMKPTANLSDDELIQFILMPGFSTAGKVTQLSGRGVGMDVVHNEVKQLGGAITVDTRRGQGTTFIIRLPLTLSIAQALMVRAGEHMYALPISAVANILEVPVENLNSIHVGRRPLLNWQDQVYPFMHLAMRLGVAPQPVTGRKVPVLLARSGGRQVAIQVDGLAGTREIVIKPLGGQLAGIEGLAGATILGDGSVVLILDVPGLWLTEEGLQVAHELAPPPSSFAAEREDLVAEAVAAAPVVPLRDRAVVMVVDDSITVRKVTQRHLSKRGVDVLLAKDGVDAMEQLRESVPDVMLVDIEMPRMDGYELTQHVRSDSRLKHVPIIMITSRAGDKHRDKAFALGVNVYMTKPYQEDELLTNINSLLPPHLASS